MHKIVIRPAAKKDIKKIWLYTYKYWGEQQADNYTNSLGEAINAIPVNPKIGSSIEHIRKGYRLYHFTHHFVIYRITSTTIDIVRVLGESMAIKRHL
ncbi:MAG: type II toxin-antitoxin system RelE/ParE family toxin [Ectothiorhodospiraceae bacterium]|nr:type II toxin-antitoxin system RelE/ParE family toxin [Ectothiorhodospiraceae bacterium]